MRRALQTQEEILARKLLNFLGSCAALLVFAIIVIFLAATQPEAPPPAAPRPPAPAEAPETADDVAATFNDRLARVRLGSAPLPERMREAETLLARAPTAGIRRQVEALLRELSQEADTAAFNAFNTLRQQNVGLAAENRFDAIEKALAEFQAENPRLAELVNGERRLLAKRRAAAFVLKEAAAQAAIARGDVAAATQLAEEARPLAGPDEVAIVETWISQAEARRSGAAEPEMVRPPEPGPDIAAAPPDEPAPPPPPSEDITPPEEAGPNASPPEEPAESVPFAGVITVGLSGTFVIPEEQSAAMIDAAGATICADVFVPGQDLPEQLTRGSPLWILGVPVVKKGIAPEFGGVAVQRTIEKARIGIAGKDFLPDLAWEDPACKGRRWLFGTVELAYPVLRVTVEGATYTLDTAAAAPAIIRRAKAAALPALPQGAGIWVKGSRSGTAIAAEEMTVLAPELAGDDAYAALFAN